MTNDDCAALLQNPDLLKLLAVTCGICQQEYKHKGNLVHHLNSRHGELVSRATPQSIALEDQHRGSERRCFCPDQSNRKQARTHKCIVFLQFAMLQEFHRRHQTLGSDAPSPAPIPMVTDSTPSPEPYDTMEDDSLALLLQQAFEQDPYKLDDPVAAFAWSDTLNQTVVKTSDGMFAIDTAALPFMDMPSYSRDIPLNNAVLAFTHSSFLTSTPRTLDHVAKGDYLAIWKDVDALYFMSRRCVCCGASFTFELAAKHTASHWGDITNLPDGIYPDCASHFFANFLALPWFQNTPCYRAVLHQTLLLRLLIELWEDGSLGCGDASNVEASLIRRRIAAGLQASQDRPSAAFEKKPQTQQQSARSRSRSRHQSGEDVESPGDQARGHVERAAATATVHPSLERRNGVVDPPNDEKQHGVAPGSGENTSTPPKTGTSALHHPATESAAPTSGETEDEIFQNGMKNLLLTEQHTFPYLTRCQKSRRLILSKDKALEKEELHNLLQQLSDLSANNDHILRFHTMKKVPAQQTPAENSSFPWMLTTSHTMFPVLQRLCYHSIWLLVAVDVKKQSLVRSPLAKQIDQQLQRRS